MAKVISCRRKYVCVCVCVCVSMREGSGRKGGEGEREREREREREYVCIYVCVCVCVCVCAAIGGAMGYSLSYPIFSRGKRRLQAPPMIILVVGVGCRPLHAFSSW